MSAGEDASKVGCSSHPNPQACDWPEQMDSHLKYTLETPGLDFDQSGPGRAGQDAGMPEMAE